MTRFDVRKKTAKQYFGLTFFWYLYLHKVRMLFTIGNVQLAKVIAFGLVGSIGRGQHTCFTLRPHNRDSILGPLVHGRSAEISGYCAPQTTRPPWTPFGLTLAFFL